MLNSSFRFLVEKEGDDLSVDKVSDDLEDLHEEKMDNAWFIVVFVLFVWVSWGLTLLCPCWEKNKMYIDRSFSSSSVHAYLYSRFAPKKRFNVKDDYNDPDPNQVLKNHLYKYYKDINEELLL